MRPPLTDEQKVAATASEGRVFIQAAPGSGKTTVATERYGVSRFGQFNRGKGVLALSFARSARGELRDRVRRRWGAGATRWPHKVWTLDHLHFAIVRHLLVSGVLRWPGGCTELDVVDTWRGHSGHRWRAPGDWRRGVNIVGSEVKLSPSFRGGADYAFTTVGPYRTHLENGLCTHTEIRMVVSAAVADGSPFLAPVRDFLRDTVSSLIVDEIFDGNELDLRIVVLAAEAGVPTALIGDPWQALYGFRGAAPELVPALVSDLDFARYPITESFRFETAEMQALAASLRAGLPSAVAAGDAAACDAVISSAWAPLWACSDDVLPLSFGSPGNRLDAAIALLLDQVVTQRFDVATPFGGDAAVLLRLDPAAVRAEGTSQLAPVLTTLADGTKEAAVAALAQLRANLKDIGSPTISNLAADKMEERYDRLRRIGARLSRPHLIPGLTAHQAKGREWNRVGVVLSDAEQQRVEAGLSMGVDTDRTVYVALTRARLTTVTV